MMHFHEDPESNNIFWVIMAAMSLVVLVFIIELFIMFYLYL
jgi:hypothetical protein